MNGCLYILLYLKWITNKDLPYSKWNSAQYDMVAWLGGEFGVNGNVYGWLSPFTVHLKLSQHCSSVIPQYKLKTLKYGGKIMPLWELWHPAPCAKGYGRSLTHLDIR